MSDKNKLYIVSQQSYEAVFVFGVFSKDELDDALNVLAEKHIDRAKKAKEDQKHWYEKVHLSWSTTCTYGCSHMPYSLSVSLIEYSKYLFNVTEIEADTLFEDGILL